ncbi:hypothetical protein SUGI_0446140 [Cryptomeria japonica]|nr:hypothetical protein SUGI_0446140 [Cryptomeria japonica]
MGSRCEEVYVAVGKDPLETVSILQWALHYKPAESLVLLHVQLPITTILSPFGKIPVNQVCKSVLDAHEEDKRQKINDFMEIYLQICSEAKVQVKALVVKKADICSEIIEMVKELGIRKLIMGTSSAFNSTLYRKSKMQRPGKAGYVLKQACSSCDISVVCKGKLLVVREGSVVDNASEDFGRSFSFQTNFEPDLAASIETPHFGKVSVPRGFTLKVVGDFTPDFPDEVKQSCFEASSEITTAISEHSSDIQLAESRQIYSDETQLSPKELTDTETLKFLLTEALEVAENARRAMQRETVRRNNAEAAAIKSARKFTTIEAALEDAILVSKMKEEYCQELTRRLKEVQEELQAVVDNRRSLATQVAKFSQERDQAVQELHAAEQKLAAMRIQNSRILKQKEEETKQLQDLLHSRSRLETPSSSSTVEFSKYSPEDIKGPSRNFSDHSKPAGGGYGTVYKAQIGEATVSVKIVCDDSLQSPQEFQREIEFCREIRHPNLVTVVGACFEQGCILYEYMTNGTLADRLRCKDSTPPLPWHTRIRIAADVCSALQYLHSLKPDPIVHRDLKPESIFLDKNYVGKISDIRLARRQRRDAHKDSEIKGTFLYMDPEYLRSGEFSTKSDVYSLGMICLQLLTGKPALGLVKDVESALENSKLDEVLDPSAGKWPFALATQLAYLALHCTEPVRNNRPDIQPSVMQMLEKLRKFTVVAPEIGIAGDPEEAHVPGLFLCPILMTVMRDPHIAADGFTYERDAIQEWFYRGNLTSPMTNKKLKRKDLVANYSL